MLFFNPGAKYWWNSPCLCLSVATCIVLHPGFFNFGCCCQTSSQNKASFLFLISKMLCGCMISLLFHARFHIVDPWIEPVSLTRYFIWKLGAYFASHSFAHGFSPPFSHLHHNSRPFSLLVISGSCSPRPPAFFDLQTVFNATNAHFCFSSAPRHRKFL